MATAAIVFRRSGSGGGSDPLALFEADFSQTTLTGIGFTDLSPGGDTDTPNGRCTRSIVTNGGPSGSKQAIRWEHFPKTPAFVTGLGNAQGYWGAMESDTNWTAPGPGESLFFHFYLRVVEATNCDNIESGGGVISNDFRQKTIDIGGGATGSSRFILYSAYGQSGGTGALSSWEMAMSVGTDRSNVRVRPTESDGWVAVVMELVPATSIGGTNGIFRIGMNRDSGWDVENTGIAIDDHEGSASWDGINFHSFNDVTLGDADGVGPSLIIEMGGCKVRRTRDTSWYASMTS